MTASERSKTPRRFTRTRRLIGSLPQGISTMLDTLSSSAAEPGASRCVSCSVTMVGIARKRLDAYKLRSSVTQTDGSPDLPLADASCDRFVSTYVLDLLTGSQIEAVVTEAHRLLCPDGLLCITSLTHGQGAVSKSMIALWKALHRLSPALVGGCRPIGVSQYVSADKWHVKLRTVLVRWGVPSEVFVARRLAAEETAAARPRR
jgi:Methyltransferase domain